MPPSQKLQPPRSNESASPRNSATPLLQHSEAQQGGETETSVEGVAGDSGSVDSKTAKRKLFGLGLGKTNEENIMETSAGGLMPQTQAAINAMKPAQAPALKPSAIALSPSRHPYPSAAAASPSRLRSSSPRLHSPASSEIFERNVQEPVPISTLQGELSHDHIATHVITEDHIPPALEASAQAIASEKLNPDEVEIVTSSAHQPASASVIESSTSHADLTQLQSPGRLRHQTSDASDYLPALQHSGVLPGASEDDGASNYGQLDPNDVRRLSFISFADVVQSEHHQQAVSHLGDMGSRDSLHIGSLPSSVPSVAERAGSPLRSPRSPGSTHSQTLGGGMATPPPGVNINPIGEQSPARSLTGVQSAGQHGELTIETMRQALRKTASGDLSSVRTPAMSPISDENSFKETRSRTNT